MAYRKLSEDTTIFKNCEIDIMLFTFHPQKLIKNFVGIK